MFGLWISTLLVGLNAYAGFCVDWETGHASGWLPKKELKEASGMAISSAIPNRIYWVNDSGDKGFLYLSSLQGDHLQAVKIQHFKPIDAEALSYTECDKGFCVVIGDIGDNRRRRKEIKLIFIKERSLFGRLTEIDRTLILEYPDAPHDAEAMAFLPNGDLWIVTKEIHLSRMTTEAAQIFALSKADWQGRTDKKLRLKKVGDLPLPKWLPEDPFFLQAVTDMAIDLNRHILGLLTYGKVIEIPLSKLADVQHSSKWKRDQDYAVVKIKSLPQQETLAYVNDPNRMLWSTEHRGSQSPIFSMACKRSVP